MRVRFRENLQQGANHSDQNCTSNKYGKKKESAALEVDVDVVLEMHR